MCKAGQTSVRTELGIGQKSHPQETGRQICLPQSRSTPGQRGRTKGWTRAHGTTDECTKMPVPFYPPLTLHTFLRLCIHSFTDKISGCPNQPLPLLHPPATTPTREKGPDLAQSRTSQAGTNAGHQEEGWAGLLSTRAGGFQMSHSCQIEAIWDWGRGQPKQDFSLV